MKKAVIVFLIAPSIILLVSIVHADHWGSSQSNKYHNPCTPGEFCPIDVIVYV